MYTDPNLPNLNQITCLKKSAKKAEEKKQCHSFFGALSRWYFYIIMLSILKYLR